MKRIISSALIIMLTISAAQAQTIPTEKPQSHNQKHKMAVDQLNLSTDQKARLKSIREDFKKQIADLKNNNQLSTDEKRTRRRELHQQFQSQFESVLTPQQKEQWAQLKSQKKANKERTGQFNKDDQDKHSHSNAFQRDKKFQEELGLTEDQQQKVTQIRSDFRPKFQTLRSDSTLSQDQRRTKMHQLRQQEQEQMKTVLTPEQIQKMESLRKEHTAENTK